MLEYIRTDRFLNILVSIFTLVGIGLWCLTESRHLLYGGVGVGLYWAFFFWLQFRSLKQRGAYRYMYSSHKEVHKELCREKRLTRVLMGVILWVMLVGIKMIVEITFPYNLEVIRFTMLSGYLVGLSGTLYLAFGWWNWFMTERIYEEEFKQIF